MKLSKSVFGILVVGLVLLIGASTETFGQGRGRRAGRGDDSRWDRGSRRDKKCAKFVNCHDARDGRWDGRGPNRDRDDSLFGSIFRRNRRDRDRDRDRDIFDRRRRRDRDRDFDRDRFWRRGW